MLFKQILFPALLETIYMVVVSTILAVVLAIIPSVILIVTSEKGLKPNKYIYSILDFIINILRSFPFIILMIAIVPITKLIVGKTIGTTAAIIPLTIGAMPFATRVIEGAMKEVDYGIVEAAKAMGASNWQIIFKVIISEALPSIINGITLTAITVVGYSAMAGAIGGRGLGDVAVTYGYYMFKTDVMIYTVIILIILVQLMQWFGNLVYKILK
ncbi:methionine ABC transporter permease [Haloimpatiens sp. FM7330]|uniref:methionine ABC transporter permease n=1 Tax=Haloimpatiens sp. FM7330 TaxID=3298610 RepID=UPI0036398BDE